MRTVVAFPLLYIVVYVMLYLAGPYFGAMVVAVLVWGCSAFRWTGGFAELDGARRSRRA